MKLFVMLSQLNHFQGLVSQNTTPVVRVAYTRQRQRGLLSSPSVVLVVWGPSDEESCQSEALVGQKLLVFVRLSKRAAVEVIPGRDIFAIRMKARTVVGKGEKSLLSDTGSELRLGREKGKGKVRRQQKGKT